MSTGADELKAKGNAALQAEKFDEAIDFYTKGEFSSVFEALF